MGAFVVIEGASSAAEARRAIEDFGRPAVDSWAGAAGMLCTGVVRTADDAQRVVLAALAGADLVVDCRADRGVTDEMCDDLRRLGRLDHRVVTATSSALTDDQRKLLSAIASGASLGSAAAALHLSRRTADRRIAAARETLGAASTAEAIVKARKLSLLPPSARS